MLVRHDIPPNAIVIVDDQIGLSPNVGHIARLRLNPDDYEFKDKLRVDGYWDVWSGFDKKTGRPVALKRLFEFGDYPSPWQATLRFPKEVLIEHSILHPSVLPVYGYLPACPSTGNHIAIVRPLMVNDSVQSAIRQQPAWFDLTAKVKILIGTASGMVFLHDHNILHRDLKPSDILLDESFEPKISDLFFVEVLPTPEALLALELIGTRFYMAPEIHRDEPIGLKTDVYSFGVIMYVILTCLTPGRLFPLYYWKKIVEGERPEFPGDTPGAVVELARSCWAADPNKRPASREVLQTLGSRKFLESIPGLDLRVLRNFASRTVPPELRGFLR